MRFYRVQYTVQRWYGAQRETFYTYAHSAEELRAGFDASYSEVIITEC